MMLSSSFLGASHQRYSSSSSSFSGSSLSFFAFFAGAFLTEAEVSALALPLAGAALTFFRMGASESDSSFLIPFVLPLAETPLDSRFLPLAAARGASSSDSALIAFLGVDFFCLDSLARIALASFAALFSMDFRFWASLAFRGWSSSESSRVAVSLAAGGSFLGLRLRTSSSESSAATFLWRFA